MSSEGHPAGNTNDEKRGRGAKEGVVIGQKIPEKVKDQIKPKEK